MTTVDIDVDWRGGVLAGTLHLPGDDPLGTMLMLQGSGPADRNADGYFDAVRGTFLRRGVATFSFDKPGCGRSSGEWRHHALFDRADQANTVLDALASRPGVEAHRIGVWGQSQGGWVVQILAARRPGLAFVIGNSAPSISVERQDLHGCEHWMRSIERSDEDISAALEQMRALHEAAARRAAFDDVEGTLLAPARGRPWGEYLSVDESADWEHMVGLVVEAYEPIPTLQQISCPFLAVFGGRDVLVPPWSSATETGEALGSCADATVAVFPHGDHRIQVGGPYEFAPGYLDLLGDWAVERLRRAG